MRTSLFFAAACLMATLTAGIELKPIKPVNAKHDEVMGNNGTTQGVDSASGPTINQAKKIFGDNKKDLKKGTL